MCYASNSLHDCCSRCDEDLDRMALPCKYACLGLGRVLYGVMMKEKQLANEISIGTCSGQ